MAFVPLRQFVRLHKRCGRDDEMDRGVKRERLLSHLSLASLAICYLTTDGWMLFDQQNRTPQVEMKTVTDYDNYTGYRFPG